METEVFCCSIKRILLTNILFIRFCSLSYLLLF